MLKIHKHTLKFTHIVNIGFPLGIGLENNEIVNLNAVLAHVDEFCHIIILQTCFPISDYVKFQLQIPLILGR